MEREIPRLRFSKRCLRISLMLSSIILWVQGATFLLLGVFIHNFLKNFFVDGRGLKEAGGFPIASIILGTAMVSIGLLINYFIIFSSKLRYFSLALMLLIIFAFEVIFFIVGFEYARTIEEVLKEGYETAMKNYKDAFIINMELNTLQWMFHCCGVKDFKDWYITSWAGGRMEVPESCCIDIQQCHNLEPVMVDDIHQTGCNEKIKFVIKAHNISLIFGIIVAAITQILGIALTINLGIKDTETTTRTPSERPIINNI